METKNELHPAWWKEAVVYQIYPRSFNDTNNDGIGDINGITEKLDYLKELGVDVLWLSPIYASPNEDNGYDISNYREIMKDFGTMEDFDRMLEEAHKRDIKIMMDLVVNHTSDEHEWFKESKKSKDNPYRDYYIWKDGGKDKPYNNWGSYFSGSVWEYVPETDSQYLHLFAKKQPDLNWENPKVRQEVYDLMKFWLDKGVDGFRMDVINLISKDQSFPDGKIEHGLYGDMSPYVNNGPRIHEFLKEMNKEVLSKYDIITVGEMPGASVEDAKKYSGKDEHELEMIFQFEMMGLDHGEYGKWTPVPLDLKALKANFKKWQDGLAEKGWNSLYWDNHDQPRIVSRFGNDSTETREKSAKMLATVLHMHQGTPYIYQGEELGMTNVDFPSISDYRDIEILNAYKELVQETKKLSEEEFMKGVHKLSRDNARTPMQWSDEINGGFSTVEPWIQSNPNYKTINAKDNLEREDSVFHYYQKLLKLRKENPIITYGSYEQFLPEDESLYVFARELDGQNLLIAANFTDQPHSFEVPEKFLNRESKVLITNGNEKDLVKNIELAPYEAIVWNIE